MNRLMCYLIRCLSPVNAYVTTILRRERACWVLTFYVSMRPVATTIVVRRLTMELEMFSACKRCWLTWRVQCGRQDVTSPARRGNHSKTFVFLECFTVFKVSKVVRVLLV